MSLHRYSETLDLWSRLLARYDAAYSPSVSEGANPPIDKLKANICRVRYLLGAQLAAEEDYAAATSQWEQYLKHFPSDNETSKDLAELYLRQALQQLDSPAAEPLLNRALALDPQNPHCGYFRALYHLKHRRFDDALDQLQVLPQDARGSLSPRPLSVAKRRNSASDAAA